MACGCGSEVVVRAPKGVGGCYVSEGVVVVGIRTGVPGD